MIRCREGICDVLLPPAAIASVLRLTVYGVAHNAIDRFLLHKGDIVSSGPISGRHGRSNRKRTGISGIDPMILVNHWGMPVHLGTERSCNVLGHIHPLTTLIVKAENARHHICTAFTGFESWSAFLLPSNTSCSWRGSCTEAGSNKCLLFHARLSRQSSCDIVQIPDLISLIGSKGYRISCNKGLHLHVVGRHESARHTMQIDPFIPLIDMISL